MESWWRRIAAAIGASVVVVAIVLTVVASGPARTGSLAFLGGVLVLGALFAQRTAGLNRARRAVRLWLAKRPMAVAVLVAGAAIAGAVVIVKWAPDWLASTNDLTPSEAAEERGRVRTALLALLAGLLAALGAYYTHRTFGLNRAGQITERFTRAIDQLGRSELDVRLGGIYALERIARDSKDDHPQVVEVLTAYIREHARWRDRPSEPGSRPESPGPAHPQVEAIRALERVATGSQPAKSTSAKPAAERDIGDRGDLLEPRTDVQAAMSVLGRRDQLRDRSGDYLDLAGTDLRHLVLVGADQAHLEGARLAGAHLENAHLSWARLNGANLHQAHLQGADLHSAQLQGADLRSARLDDASLNWAQLQDAALTEAHLERANLYGARLERADLMGAHLEEAFLQQAQLQGALMQGAHLEHANLNAGVHLEGARLDGAHLEDADLAGLTEVHLEGTTFDGTHYNDATKLPEWFNPRAAGACRAEDEPGSLTPCG